MQPTPARRPGGRSARVRADVTAATLAELALGGYSELSVEKIAERAGVNKTTIYRRWSDLDSLLAETLAELGSTAVPIPDTGDLDTDLRTLADLIRAVITDPVIAALLRGLCAAATRSPRAAQVLRDFFLERARLGGVIVRRAVARGELPAGTDPMAAIEALGGPFYLRLLVTGEPIDPAFAARAAAAMAAAARAGVFT
jgi:AcrR family transcriptional regulator